jgi:hypothetical protein
MEEILKLEARMDELAKQLLTAKDARVVDIINEELDSIEQELYAIKFSESGFNEFVENY